jgi:hypothetical protein
MRLFYTDERPLALPAIGCAPARAHRVGYLTVLGVSPRWQGRTERSVALIQQQKSVQLQETPVRIDGTNGFTAKATGMAHSLVTSVDASGVPPRGKPV